MKLLVSEYYEHDKYVLAIVASFESAVQWLYENKKISLIEILKV